MPHSCLRDLAQVRDFQLVERCFHFRAPGQDAHPSVVEIVIITKPLAFLQVGPRRFGRSLCSDDVGLVYNLVLQLPPFNVEPALIRVFA